MRTLSSRRRQKSRGSVFVESAFVFMGFALMVIGTFDFAQFLFTHQALVERTRSAARWGEVNGPTNTEGIRNMLLYNQPTSPSQVDGRSARGYLGLTANNVSVTTTGAGTVDYRLTVKIENFQFSMFSPFLRGVYRAKPIVMTIPIAIT